MHELGRISERIQELRVALNRYGDSDESVLIAAREWIFDRSDEVRRLYEQLRVTRQQLDSVTYAGTRGADEQRPL